MIRLGRLRSFGGPVVVVVVVWALLAGGMRSLVWADLRKGMIDLRGLSMPTRALITLGFGLLAVMVGALLFSDAWRAASPLLPTLQAEPGRGKHLPLALLPLTLFMLSAAWAFGLAGALHAGLAVRLGVLLLYLSVCLRWITSGVALGLAGADPRLVLVAGAATLAVPLVFGLRWRAPARPAAEFGVLFVLVTATFGPIHAEDVAGWRRLGSELVLTKTEEYLSSFYLLVAPLLLLIGVDIASFTRRVAGWTTEIVAQRAAARWLRVILLVLVVWRLREVLLEALDRVGRSTLGAELLAYGGAALELLAVGLICWLVSRRGGPPEAEGVAETGERYAIWLILAYGAIQLAAGLTLMLSHLLVLFVLPQGTQAVLQANVRLVGTAGWVDSTLTVPWRLGLGALAALGAVWLAGRGRRTLALVVGSFGVLLLWAVLTTPGRPLAALSRRGPEPIDFWWMMIIGAFALVWLARGRLTSARASRLLFLVFVTWLLRQTDFIENPFKPLFGVVGLSGIAFLAFGIIWDALTKGAWANVSTPRLPRVARILLYLGYVLLVVTVVNWSLTGHDLLTVNRFTGEWAFSGLDRFGRPILYAVFAATLAGEMGEQLAPGRVEPNGT